MRRALLVGSLLLLLPGAPLPAFDGGAAGALVPPPPSRPGPEALRRAGRYDGDTALSAYARAYVPGVTGQLVFTPHPGVVFTDRSVPFNHGSPWEYDTRVPLVFYGPGQVRRVVMEGAQAQSYDLMPTLAAALRVPGPPTFRGRAWREVLVEERPAPRALLVVVMDQVGLQDVRRFEDRMPTLTRWRREGADFPSTRLNYLPSVTAVSHAGIGTGAPPAFHGVTNNLVPDATRRGLQVVFRRPSGRADPRRLAIPTFADWLDLRYDNRSVIVSQVYAEYAAVAMAGHGLAHPGGDADIVVWYDDARGLQVTDPRFYRMPAYVDPEGVRKLVDEKGATLVRTPEVEAYLEERGAPGAWKTVRATPWFARFRGDQVLEMMARERVGADEVPDLVMVNLKSSDAFGHSFGHDHPGYARILREIDRFLASAERLLRRRAGDDGFVIAVTADHGLGPDDSARRANEDLAEWLGRVLDAQGDRDGVDPVIDVDAYHVHLDMEELAEEGLDLEAVRDVLRRDPDVLDVWTAPELAARREELYPELRGSE